MGDWMTNGKERATNEVSGEGVPGISVELSMASKSIVGVSEFKQWLRVCARPM